ncbi:MAG: peptidylprolyl isomerase [Rhodospirillaceae bacterium]|nr:peptidylprolyl isomerase [Rhodospirillaceae bacterium]
MPSGPRGRSRTRYRLVPLTKEFPMHRLALCGLVAFLSISLFSFSGLASESFSQLAQAKTAKPAKKIVIARVVGEPIFQSDIQAAFRALPPRARRAGLQRHYGRLLETLVVSKMLTIYGRRLKLETDPRVKRQLKRAEDAFVRDTYLSDLVRKQMTDKALKDEYNSLVKKNKGIDEVRARHILLQTEKKAKEIIKLLNTGQNFAELAKKNSVGRTARRGGDLGFFGRNEMTKPFSDAAFALKVGQVTKKPVKSDFGWHVIKVEEKRKRKIPPFDKVRPMIRARVGQRLSGEIVSELMRQTKVERYSYDGKRSIAAPRAGSTPPPAPKPKAKP